MPLLQKFKLITAISGLAFMSACSASSPIETGQSPSAQQATGKQNCSVQKLKQAAPSGLSQQRICILSKGKAHSFDVEMAITPEEGMRGLMFRRELAVDKGMLFPFPVERPASFWMKNTYIPLDMLFIRSDGTIESIITNVEPTSLEPRQSKGPVAAVLELAGGRTEELGVKAGDKVDWLR